MSKLMLGLFILVIFTQANATSAWSSDRLVYNLRLDEVEYVETLLEKVLLRTSPFGGASEVGRSAEFFSRARLLEELIVGDNIQIVAEVPKPGWEEKLIPIRIPLRKGIQGYRLFLINRQDQERLSQVRSLEELKAIPTGTGVQWSTYLILRKAGFNVVPGETHARLFDMLKVRRFVTFGRGMNEIFGELERFGPDNPDLAIEQTLVLFVPLPTYFFVSPARPELASRVRQGLEEMLADGSFDAHFLEYHQSDIDRARLKHRKIFTIENPNLSQDPPLNDPALWFDPATHIPEDGDHSG